jgi:Flp pilus assembly protein TadG
MRHRSGPPPLSGLLARLRRGWRARDGLAALEFALLAPILVSTVGGLYDLTTGFIAWKRVAMAAQSIDQIATSLAATTSGTNILNLINASNASSAVYAYLPNILSASPNSFGVTVSSVAMVPNPATCTVGCTYTPHVAWSGVFKGSAGTRRPCDARAGLSAMSFVPDGSNPSPTTLPASVQGSGAPLVIVDVVFTFKPIFFTYITGNIQMNQSAYFSPRTGLMGDWVQYFYAGNSDSTSICPGYPLARNDHG